MRLLLIMRLLLFTIGLKLSRGYYNGGGYYPSAVTITGNTVLDVSNFSLIIYEKNCVLNKFFTSSEENNAAFLF